jgi:hypothetical protein
MAPEYDVEGWQAANFMLIDVGMRVMKVLVTAPMD